MFGTDGVLMLSLYQVSVLGRSHWTIVNSTSFAALVLKDGIVHRGGWKICCLFMVEIRSSMNEVYDLR